MNSGEINGYMLTNCNDRQEVIEYLKTLDISKEQKNEFYAYWKGCEIIKTISKQMRVRK